MWIAHFVNKLFGNRWHADSAACSLVLRNYKRAIGACFSDGISNVREIRNRSPVKQTVAARALCTAFDDVPRDNSGRQMIPICG